MADETQTNNGEPNYDAYRFGNDYNRYGQDKLNPNAKWASVRDNQRYNNTQATYDYLNNLTDVMNKYRNDVARESSRYITGAGAANTNYTDAINTANKTYEQNTNPYVGNAGYNNALQQAQRGATQQAYNAASTATGAARSAGMNKAQAAALGMGNAINAYNNGLAQQQAQVQNNYNNALNQQGNIYGQNTNAAGNRYGQTVSQLGNAYSTNANAISGAANTLGSGLAQDIANRQNQQNINYSNQDVIEKLLNGMDSGTNGLLGGILQPGTSDNVLGNILGAIANPAAWLSNLFG